MTTLREAAWQALEALDSEHPDIQLRAAVALRAALAQEEQMLNSAYESACKIISEQDKKLVELEAANLKLAGAIDMIRETLQGGNVDDLLHIINTALAAHRGTV